MRIIAGSSKGKPFLQLPKRGGTRPTLDRVREACFQRIENIMSFSGLRVLDAFAGTGSLGLEALSRGAAHVTFVEQSPQMMAYLCANAAHVIPHASEKMAFKQAHSPEFFSTASGPFDLIFLDPPYDANLYDASLLGIVENKLLATDGLLVVESSKLQDINLTESLQLVHHAKYRKISLRLIENAENA